MCKHLGWGTASPSFLHPYIFLHSKSGKNKNVNNTD